MTDIITDESIIIVKRYDLIYSGEPLSVVDAIGIIQNVLLSSHLRGSFATFGTPEVT